MNPGKREGKRIAFLFTDGVEQVELTQPLAAVRDAGGVPRLVSLKSGSVHMFDGLERSDEIEADVAVKDVDPSDFDGLVLPGGVANPDFLRTDGDAVDFVRGFFEQDLVEAGVVPGRTLTSWPSLQTDIRNAGGNWVDEEVHVDGNLISSRQPDDLPAFCARLIEVMGL
jgi:protease I